MGKKKKNIFAQISLEKNASYHIRSLNIKQTPLFIKKIKLKGKRAYFNEFQAFACPKISKFEDKPGLGCHFINKSSQNKKFKRDFLSVSNANNI